jgi:hypothetical protein
MIDEMDPRLGKIVELAKRGVGGEKAAAIKLVKRICRQRGIEFDDVMEATTIREYSLDYKTKAELEVLAQVVLRFGNIEGADRGVSYRPWVKELYFRTTPDRYIEVVNAAAAYLAAFRRERRRIIKDLPNAFIIKHHLFRPDQKSERLPTPEEIEQFERQENLGRTMDDVHVSPQLGRGRK